VRTPRQASRHSRWRQQRRYDAGARQHTYPATPAPQADQYNGHDQCGRLVNRAAISCWAQATDQPEQQGSETIDFQQRELTKSSVTTSAAPKQGSRHSMRSQWRQSRALTGIRQDSRSHGLEERDLATDQTEQQGSAWPPGVNPGCSRGTLASLSSHSIVSSYN
jgi:hypothetical protein